MKRKLLIMGILTAILLLIGLLAWPLPRLLIQGLARWLDVVSGHAALLKTLCIAAAIIAGFALTLILVLPAVIYLIKKIAFYVSVFFLCLFRRYRFRITRLPFASMGGVSDKSDVEITTDEGTLCLHFVDIVFPYRRALTIPNSSEYVITSTSKGQVVREGGGSTLPRMQGGRTAVLRAKNHTLDRNRDRSRPLPSAEPADTATRHVLIPLSLPGECRYVRNGKSLPLSSGIRIGSLIFMTAKHLKRGIKGQLHTSFFDDPPTFRKEKTF